MSKLRNQLGNIYIALLVLTGVMLVNASIFKFYSSVSLYINLFFVCIGCLVFVAVTKKKFLYVIAVTIYLFISLVITKGGLGSVITFVTPLLMLFCFFNLQFSTRAKRVLIAISSIVILAIYIYSVPYGQNYNIYAYIKINPNTLAMFNMYFFMFMCVLVDLKEHKVKIGIMLLLTIMAMYNYQSRGTLLVLGCFVLFILIPQRIYTRKRVFFMTLFLLLIGTAFPYVYIDLYEKNFNLRILGKTLYTGREQIWLEMFKAFRENGSTIVFGLGSKADLWEGHNLNVHNNYFAVIVNFGVIGYILYFSGMLSQVWKLAQYMWNPVVRKSLLMFISVMFVYGFTEVSSIWAVTFSFVYFGLIVANAECINKTGYSYRERNEDMK